LAYVIGSTVACPAHCITYTMSAENTSWSPDTTVGAGRYFTASLLTTSMVLLHAE